MKYKAGDIVKIKTLAELWQMPDVWVSSDFADINHHNHQYCVDNGMHESLGGVHVIQHVYDDGSYEINGIGCWQDWMIAYAEEIKATITVNPDEDEVWGQHINVKAPDNLLTDEPDLCECGEPTDGIHVCYHLMYNDPKFKDLVKSVLRDMIK